jgi:hypothetical protein
MNEVELQSDSIGNDAMMAAGDTLLRSRSPNCELPASRLCDLPRVEFKRA